MPLGFAPILPENCTSHLRYTRQAMSNISPEIELLVRDFVEQMVAAVQAQSTDRVLAVVGAALGRKQLPPARRERQATKPTTKAAGRKLKLSPETLAVRRLQGKYLGVLRALTPGKRARVKKVAREKGIAQAIKFAGSLK
jgi:hypothetical protein